MGTEAGLTTIEGPTWSHGGLTIGAGRYPLRVEGHVGRMVGVLLPGVISTTTQARMYCVHAFAWSEAARRKLDLDEALELVRRCEVVVAGASLCHNPHLRAVPAAHGAGEIEASVSEGTLPLDEFSQPNGHASGEWGFAGTYLGSEERIRVVDFGRPPVPGPRLDRAALDDGLRGLLDLAEKATLSINELVEAGHLCVCAAPENADGQWIRRVLFEGGLSDWSANDQARQNTARLLIGLVANEPTESPRDLFQRRIGFGEPLESFTEPLRRRVAESWRGTILRNYSVGAWRGIWAWLVDQLAEGPQTVSELADRLQEAVPDISVADLLDAVSASSDGSRLIPLEEELRLQSARDPWVQFRLLALGTRRLDELSGDALLSFAPERAEDDLGPRWVAQTFSEAPKRPLGQLAKDWATLLFRRAQAVALTKMRREGNGFWMPSRIREREGVILRISAEGAGAVGLRIGTLTSVLTGVGALETADDGIMHVTEEGERLLG